MAATPEANGFHPEANGFHIERPSGRRPILSPAQGLRPRRHLVPVLAKVALGFKGGCLRREYLEKGKLLSGFLTIRQTDCLYGTGGSPDDRKGQVAPTAWALNPAHWTGAVGRGASFVFALLQILPPEGPPFQPVPRRE